ncbi:MAG TPA: YqeG family HAD IIIA-type phosphatase [Desulfotomaculum sp.]|nr:YqeG family HAD IIIA-type phosphatase [Desulfotomaculum sp.]
MLEIFYPRLFISSLPELDLKHLLKLGLKGILLDLDNTIIMRGTESCSPEIIDWLNELQGCGFKLCIISNNKSARVKMLAGELKVPAVYYAFKPFKRAFYQALGLIKTAPEETAIIGDQIFTDILGGNRLGLFTILVVPLNGKEHWLTRLINRRLEKALMVYWRKKQF